MARKAPKQDERYAERVELRMSAEEKDAFSKAADEVGLSLSQWIRFAARMVIVQHNGKIQMVDLK